MFETLQFRLVWTSHSLVYLLSVDIIPASYPRRVKCSLGQAAGIYQLGSESDRGGLAGQLVMRNPGQNMGSKTGFK